MSPFHKPTSSHASMDNSNPAPHRVWLLSQELMLNAGLDCTIRATNPAWGRILGWSEAQLRGTKYTELVHPEDLEKTIEEVARLAAGTTSRLDNRYRHQDGSYRWIAWTAVRDGQSVHAIGRAAVPETDAVAGMPESGETSSRGQKIDTVGRFAGVIAHDFNNLFQGIAGPMELVRKLIKTGRVEQTEKFIDAAMKSVDRAVALTGRLHVFSSRGHSDPQPVDVNLVIDSMKDLLRGSQMPSIDLRLTLLASWTASCGARQLEGAILELITNAREAMPDGGSIAIETTNASMDSRAAGGNAIAPGQYVCIAVTDSGSGMSEEVIQHAFEPLFTTKVTGLGTGLGLSMVYNFVRQVQGYVRIQSEIGKGTTVKLYLPRYGGDEA
jgi:PAS domain S-box-containing protein